jgi:nicotine blue oxidoreductase
LTRGGAGRDHAAVKVAAVLLAAGAGSRLGRGPKALLPFGERTFLASCLDGLLRAGVEEVAVVLGHEAARVAAAAGVLPRGVRLLENPRWVDGMLSSALLGLDAVDASGAEALLLHPVDCPTLSPETIARVLGALAAGAPIAVPSFARRRGHPAGFARSTWSALRAAPAERGVRAVLHEHPDWIAHVEGDPGCLVDVDTPADLEGVSPRAW